MSLQQRRTSGDDDKDTDAQDNQKKDADEVRGILLTPFRVFVSIAALALLFAACWVLNAQPPRLPTKLRPNTSLFVACNLYNNEDILLRFNSEIMRLVSMVGAENLFVSVFENGSTDGTKEQLQHLKQLLGQAGVAHAVQTSSATWKSYSNHVNGPHRVLRQRQAAIAAQHPPVPSNASAASVAAAAALGLNAPSSIALRSAGAKARIPIMARVRNEALKPLLSAPWLAAHAQRRHDAPDKHMGLTWMPAQRGEDTEGDTTVRVLNPLFEPLFGEHPGGPDKRSPPLPTETAAWVTESIASALGITPPQELTRKLQQAQESFAWSQAPGIGLGESAAGNGPMRRAEGNLGLPHPVTIVFVNDVKLKAEHIIAMANTAGGNFDVACALDFAILKLYDTWVIRDLAGRTLSGWWPFLREPETQAMLSAGRPFPVSQCWNGMVALNAAAWVGKGLLFRPWQHQEQRGIQNAMQGEGAHEIWRQQWWSHLRRLWNTVRVEWMSPPTDVPQTEGGGGTTTADGVELSGISTSESDAKQLGAHAGGVYSGNCAASECGLFTKDLIEAGHPRVLVNPAVQLVYDQDSYLLQTLLMSWVNPLLMAWANRPHRHGPMMRGCVYPACRHIPGSPPLSSMPLQQHTSAWQVLLPQGTVQTQTVHTWWVPPPRSFTCGLDGYEAEELDEAAAAGRLPPWRRYVVGTALGEPTAAAEEL